MELTAEFYKALTVSWLCFAAGAGLFHAYKSCQYGKVLSRLLLALSPGILSAYGYHSVQVCNQILAAKEPQAESVSERIYLTSISYTDLGDGYAWTTERYSDGTVRASGQVRSAAGCHEGESCQAQADSEGAAGPRGSLVPMQARSESVIDGADFRASVF